MRCRSPPERRWPRSPKTVSKPFGNDFTKGKKLRGGQRVKQLRLACAGLRIQKVRTDRVVKKMGILHHHSNGVADGFSRGVAKVNTIHADCASGDVVESGRELDERGFPSAGRADQCDELAGFHAVKLMSCKTFFSGCLSRTATDSSEASEISAAAG